MQLMDLTWAQVEKLPRDMPVLIPIAALEQHGRHMPLFTDSLLLGEVVRRVQETLEDRVLFTPLMWLGNSEHHLDFPGTMTASPRVYLDLLRDLAENFLFHGFQRLVFLNGHGGNIVPSQQVVFELRQKYRERNDLLLLASTYWTLGGQPHEVNPEIKQTHMGHACEWETSMMLRIRPELVQRLDIGAAGGIRQSLPAGQPRLDHQGPQPHRPHRRPAPRHRGKRGNAIKRLCRRCGEPLGTRHQLERPILVGLKQASGGRQPPGSCY